MKDFSLSRSGVSRASAGARERQVSWLEALSRHVTAQRRRLPGEELAVIIDVDGSLLDLRPGLAALLCDWDRRHGTQHFAGLAPTDVAPGEAGLRRLFEARGLSYAAREELLVECERFAWSPAAVIGAHEPCLGMLEVLRWMQTQPGVFVVLNSSRSDRRREETLQALRTLCRHYGMGLNEDRVHLNAHGDGIGGVRAKIEGVAHFRRRGLVPVAIVDDDPEAVRQMSQTLQDPNVLCLVGEPFARAGTRAARRPVTSIWTGLESGSDLEMFGAANVPWAEVQLERSGCGELATRPTRGTAMELDELLGSFAQLGRGLRLRFDEPTTASRALGVIAAFHFPWSQIAVRLGADQLDDSWFAALSPCLPQLAIAVDGSFLVPMTALGPDLVASALARLRERGVRRIAVPARSARLTELEALVRSSGCTLEMIAGPGPVEYVAAVMAGPDAVACSFDRSQTREVERSSTVAVRRLGALTV